MPIRLLIADDHAVFRSGLRALLEQEADMRVVGEAGDGFAAVEGAARTDFDVLLLDLNLPGLPGAKVAEMVLEADPRAAIVVLTMHDDDFYLQELFKIGALGFVLKKSTGTELLQAIRAAARHERYVDPSMAGHVIASIVGRRPTTRPSGRLDVLTAREREVVELLARGYTNAEMASRLSISERTVETHRANVMGKLGLHSRAEVVRFAIEHKLLSHF